MWEYNHTDELYHYGVKGMKWGVRKFRQKSAELDKKKASYKKAKKAYSKSFSKAYNRSLAAYSPFKKHLENNSKRWDDAADKAEALKQKKAEYKAAKKEMRQNTTVGQKIHRGAKKAGSILKSVGTVYAIDLIYNNGRGAAAVKTGAKVAANMLANKMYNTAILDATGKVIYRYNS